MNTPKFALFIDNEQFMYFQTQAKKSFFAK